MIEEWRLHFVRWLVDQARLSEGVPEQTADVDQGYATAVEPLSCPVGGPAGDG